MSTLSRFNKAYKHARVIPFNDRSRFIFFSDCHRGDNSFADEFANKRNIYYHALKQYFKKGYTYIELGDGDELWENRKFEDLFEAHKNIYFLLKEFYDLGRLHMIFGNHDFVYKNDKVVKKHYETWWDPHEQRQRSFMPDLEFHEAIILRHEETGQELFLLHGHQADWFNYLFWPFARFMVRVLWKPLQVVGITDPTSPAKNNKELFKVERRAKKWIATMQNKITIIGHTHRPRFPEPGAPALFNDGSCVHPRSITGIELSDGALSLIKWNIDTTEEGYLQIKRSVLEGPRQISEYNQGLSLKKG
ncbi:serine/threonine protein phosphatase [Robertkochia marina]|uniref:Serine/threonine protein phosphatase n=1 Tax=Robertkochia marina TaxID=1227945 RepID=A0A4S3M4B7_9FLAO|nr:metallophosphoesterase [Robertkochia marina]THD69740.1 serine/threonine protein phosphatase [Robertkochia marina]TRZ46916.1 serine/threonine protein phosphatase [Robertkochia marina]